MSKINNNKKYYIIDHVAKETGAEDYFLFDYDMFIHGCRYVPFNECTTYPTFEKAEQRCKEYNDRFKRGCPIQIMVGCGEIKIKHP